MEKKRPKLILFTAPSGAGKTTIVRHLLKTFDELAFSVSATTRSRRPKEEDGKDYYFLTPEKFRHLIDNEEFVEWEEVYENQFYGTLKNDELPLIGDSVYFAFQGKFIVFDVEVKGATNIKKFYGEEAYAVFVKPPSLQVLMDRLKQRKTETAKSFEKRIRRAKEELKYENKFDRILVNDILEVTLKEAEMIVEDVLKIQPREESKEPNG
ncbi:MAG: guanylate kinase [Bacteroidota bacterium]